MDKVGVLIVDDEHDIRMLLGALLEEEGYAVYQAADGIAALEQLHAHPEGLVVLLDVLLPMDGIATLKVVETEASLATQHAYILMTALDPPLPEQIRPLLQRLDVQAVAKPIDVRKLIEAIQTAARRLGHAE